MGSEAVLAVIGGSGSIVPEWLEDREERDMETPYGKPSAPLTLGRYAGCRLLYLPRHGAPHRIPPHRINYRANLWALKDRGATHVVAINATGGIAADMQPGTIAVPDQVIDYTWGRASTFFEDGGREPVHVDFTRPYCEALRRSLCAAGRAAGVPIRDGGTYGATQGPRLESAAEIDRLERDGCDLVGMTGMPEAALALELGLCYASCAVVSNKAAGRSPKPLHPELLQRQLQESGDGINCLLRALADGAPESLA